ncbi:MAG: hypothetical protein IPP90_10575 [Gemmatimonadaceae bacterium]|nr:hypothetical protein [Gemmatimonadaceae bacterium]
MQSRSRWGKAAAEPESVFVAPQVGGFRWRRPSWVPERLPHDDAWAQPHGRQVWALDANGLVVALGHAP